MSLNTPFVKPAMTAPDLGGQGTLSRGSDPLIDTAGSPALQSVWPQDKYIVPVPGGEETGNPISGLPLQPNRWEPAESSVEPPSLQDRNPGTIDKR